jgi:hypothetical protein
MARDLKLANWTFTAASGSSVMTIVASTPSGDPTATAGTFTLNAGAVAANNVGVFRGASDAKNVAGSVNSKIDVSSFANFIAGNEVSSIANQPALWGNTSYMNMYARAAVSIGAQLTGSTVTWPAVAGGYIVLEGAYDNGASTPVASGLWVPISGPIPLVSGVAALSTTALVTLASSGLFVTTTNHFLVPGDQIVFSSVGGLGGTGVPVVDQVYQVLATPTQTTFTIATLAAPTVALVVTGTSTGAVVQKLLAPNGVTKIVSAPLTQSLRPWLRWAVHYFSTNNTNVSTVTISKTALVLGRDNAIVG